MSIQDKVNDLRPLILVFAFVIGSTAGLVELLNLNLMKAGQVFMSLFFLTFGSFKLYNFEGFVNAFKMYDPLAERSNVYAKGYPFIELGLGLAYASLAAYSAQSIEILVYLVTILVVGLNAFGVFKALTQGRKIQCACLGDVFNVPMTWATLLEDLLMIMMALAMLLMVFLI